MRIGNILLITKDGEHYKNYRKDKKAIIYATSVRDLANNYRKQLTMCQKNLNKNKYIIF